MTVSGIGAATHAAPVLPGQLEAFADDRRRGQRTGAVVNGHVSGLARSPPANRAIPRDAVRRPPRSTSLDLFPALGGDQLLEPPDFAGAGDQNDLGDLRRPLEGGDGMRDNRFATRGWRRACRNPSGGCCRPRRLLRKPWTIEQADQGAIGFAGLPWLSALPSAAARRPLPGPIFMTAPICALAVAPASAMASATSFAISSETSCLRQVVAQDCRVPLFPFPRARAGCPFRSLRSSPGAAWPACEGRPWPRRHRVAR